MKDYKKLYAPDIKLYEQYYRSNRINENTRLTEQSAKFYDMILANIHKIKPTSKERNIWELWFKQAREVWKILVIMRNFTKTAHTIHMNNL